MLTATQTSTTQQRYQTIEQKRAVLYRTLLKNPSDRRVRDALLQLSSPQQIRQAARDGIFISYARADELFALDLALDLGMNGLGTWLDALEVELAEDWKGSVADAMGRCGLMLAVMTPASLAEIHTRDERHNFMMRGKIALPVVYRDDAKDALNAVPPVDFRYNYRFGLQTLMRLLDPKPIGVRG